MNKKQWQIFTDFKKEFKIQIQKWLDSAPELSELQKNAAEKAKTPLYPFETAVVYNKDLDKITENDEIRLIVIGDNPGKDEQLAVNNRYLVGQAGKIGEGFFKRNPQLNIDFRKNVIILNKTPVHSAKTAQLREIMKTGGQKIVNLIMETELWMAQATAKLHQNLCESCEKNQEMPQLWMIGYSELKGKGFFIPYRDKLLECYKNSEFWNKVFVFQHFSMNRFSIDLKDFLKKTGKENITSENICELGIFHRKEIFGK